MVVGGASGGVLTAQTVPDDGFAPRHRPRALVRPADGPQAELFDLSLGVTSLYISRRPSL